MTEGNTGNKMPDETHTPLHSPLPWRLRTTGNFASTIEAYSGRKYNEFDDGFRIVATYQECTASDLYADHEANRAANGSLIVSSVNAVPALVAALTDLVGICERHIYPQPDKPHSDWAKVERARAALAEYRGGVK